MRALMCSLDQSVLAPCCSKKLDPSEGSGRINVFFHSVVETSPLAFKSCFSRYLVSHRNNNTINDKRQGHLFSRPPS